MIVVCGASSEGRDAASRLLVEQYGFARYSLMAPVRDALMTIDPLIAAHTTLRSQVEPNGWDSVMSSMLYRPQVVRYLGGMARMLRATFGHEILIELLESRMIDDHGGAIPEHARLLVDDARHTDEVECLRSRMGARVLYVDSSRSETPNLPERLVDARVSFELGIDELAEQLEEKVMGVRNATRIGH